MSCTVATVQRGGEMRLDEAWDVKEAVRREQGLLKQPWVFFRRSYRAGHVFCATTPGAGRILGFGIVNNDDYLSFLAVLPSEQGNGIGRRLIESMLAEYETLYLHTRTENKQAIRFYRSLGFEIRELIPGYYDNGGDAYVLEYSPEQV